MSYQVLARKWRPNKFNELVGQEHVVTAISNALDNNRLHHAYLFSGTRGVGKTTIARIFSKSLNCEQGLGAHPCGQCSTCKEIEQGNFIDLLEIDAASRTKVEDTRELLDNVQYKPSRGRYKVYLIDEVHMLSKHSFNALLKTLEEPPPHVKFLLATTDPQKLPVTILSRCLQFNLKALSRTQISQQLQHIFQQEGIENEAEALAQLARAAQGSMRDALSLSDQAIAQGNGQVSLAIVTDMLGLMDKNQVLKLLNSLLQKDAQEAMQQVEHMSFQAPDYAQVLAEMMSLLHQIALTQFVPDACKLETISARAVYQLAKTVPPEQIQLLYQIALQGKKDIAFAADGRTGLEMTMLRMLAFSPDTRPSSIEALVQQTPLIESPTDAVQATTAEPAQAVPMPSPSNEQDVPVQQNLSSGRQNAEQIPSESEQRVAQATVIDSPVSQSQHTEAGRQDSPQAFVAATIEHEDELTQLQQKQDLIAQQHDIMQEAEQHYTQSTDMRNETQVDYPPQQANFSHPAQSSEPSANSGLSATESLLALQQKLQDKQAEDEEQATQVKKSETSPSEGWIPSRLKASDNNQTPVAAVESTDNKALNQQVAPPWNTGKVETNPERVNSLELTESPEQTNSPELTNRPEPANKPLLANNLEPKSAPEPIPVFDPTAHLDEGHDCVVDFEVSAFLSDGQKVLTAQQLDSWSQLIEQMQLTALTKQLALHSVYAKQGNKVVLSLMDSKKHLNTPSAHEQLQQGLATVLQQDVVLQVDLGTPVNTPFAVQQSINQVRQQYAQDVVKNDSSIALLNDTFAARAIEDSIKAR